jgi:dihydroxy-acid dehydratase
MASLSGKAIVEMVWHDMKPTDFLTQASFDNAVSCSSCAGRFNQCYRAFDRDVLVRQASALDLNRFDALARKTPLLANLRPSGAFLMEDFYYAGGLRALLWQIRDLLSLDQLTCTGPKPLRQQIEGC